MKTVLITGANRGIGLAFCQQYLAAGWRVVAVCRQRSAELDALPVLIIDSVDVAVPESLAQITTALAGQKLDLLISNAGILRDEVLGQLDFDSIEQQFAVNALGPLRVTECLLPELNDGGKIAMITSRMGSIADNTSGGRYGYRMSKAALNIAAVSLAHDVAHRKIAVAILHPGLVATDMIGGYGDISPEQAAVRLMARIDSLSMATSGQFYHSNGESLPW